MSIGNVFASAAGNCAATNVRISACVIVAGDASLMRTTGATGGFAMPYSATMSAQYVVFSQAASHVSMSAESGSLVQTTGTITGFATTGPPRLTAWGSRESIAGAPASGFAGGGGGGVLVSSPAGGAAATGSDDDEPH